MPGKLVELMSRVRSTIQVEVTLGYEQAAARTRKLSDAVRRAVRRTERADHAGGRMIGAGGVGTRGSGSVDRVIEIHRPPFNRRYANTREIEYRPTTLPVFAGPVVREQIRQGEIGDCGVIAIVGAVAKRRPEAIQRAIRDRGDGTSDITLHNVDPADYHLSARPTGETTTFRVSNDLPHARDSPPGPPIGARSDSCSWPSLLEKALAGEDRVWDAATRSAWKLNWRSMKPEIDNGRRLEGVRLSSPRTPPQGYNRLDVGAYADDQANVLARLTGEEAVVQQLPPGHRELLAELKSQLDSNKPIVVSSRDTVEGATYPDGIYANHVYEVDRVIGDEIELKNPWGYDHPEPISARELLKFYEPEYVTLK